MGRLWFGTEHGDVKVFDPEINGLSTIATVNGGISKISVSKNGSTLVVATFKGQERHVLSYNATTATQ